MAVDLYLKINLQNAGNWMKSVFLCTLCSFNRGVPTYTP